VNADFMLHYKWPNREGGGRGVGKSLHRVTAVTQYEKSFSL